MYANKRTIARAAREANKNEIRNIVRSADGSKAVIIPAKKKDFLTDTSPRKTAVYARVSTENEQQLYSFEWQQKYYRDFVNRHEGWNLVKIYADEGISGTSLKKRDALLELLDDCRAGKVDLIVTKTVSRLSRNILDCISIVRELKALKPPVGIFFEAEGMYTLDENNEMFLVNVAAFAEHESRVRSTLQKKRFEMNLSNGRYPTPPLLGYDNDDRGRLVLNHDEATIVRLIFYMYLSGYSTEEIANKLTEIGCETKIGNTTWCAGSVLGILRNERHYGAVLAGKTYTPDFLNHKSVKNKDGESMQCFEENHHEPIVSRDDFLAVQQMLSNAKFGGNTYLPKLRVTTEGILRGFVSINPHWGAFTADDYRAASDVAGVGE